MNPLERPIFVVCPPRSGEALLGAALAAAPGTWTAGDGPGALLEGSPKLDELEGEGDSNRLVAANAREATEQLRSFLGERFPERDSPHRPADARPRLLDASPRNALRVPFLDAVFEDARFVYVNRPPQEALTEALTIWESGSAVTYPELPGWEGPPWSFLLVPGWEELRGRELPEIVTEQWVRTASTLLDDLEALAPGRWCVTDYESLLRDPATELQRLFRFLDVGFHQGLVAPFVQTARARAQSDRPGVREELKPLLPRAEEVAGRARDWIAPQEAPGRKEGSSPLRSVYTGTLIRLLDQLGSSLLVSTYQTGKLILIRHERGTVNTHFRDFQRPMGIAVHDGGFALGTKGEVLDYRDFPPLAEKLEPKGSHDACFLPRNAHYTGDIAIHEIAYVGGELWLAATRFSCLGTLDAAHSFVPRWRPPFITELAAEDRCHLNGLAVVGDRPRYVTALGETNEADGWRENKASGGIVIDVESGETVLRGLSMPHSPRWHDGRLWLLESGKGSLVATDPETGEVETIAELPGFARGLAFSGDLAFVGLSQIRETATFGGLPIEELEERLCGVWVVNVASGEVIGFLRFEEQVQEIFEVALLPGMRSPEIVERGSPVANTSWVLPGAKR
ncbi:MAG TPA: TIGR03032 family protein [Solirubrobacterales bacterium]|nr:TIGR03032 family protein [Solirubrobacterales bacterium]